LPTCTVVSAAFPNLVGGAGNNTFALVAGGAVSGSIDGQGGTNALDLSGYGAPVTVDLQASSATGVASWANIQTLKGTDTSDSLIGADTTNAWSLKGSDGGSVNGLTFTGFPNLMGGNGADAFIFASSARIAGSIDGLGGVNTLDYSAYAGGVIVNLGSGTTDLPDRSATAIANRAANAIANFSAVIVVNGNNFVTALGVMGNVALPATGNGNNILIGGSGLYDLTAIGSGNNILVGGSGVAVLNGGSGFNLLIGGSTAYDSVFADWQPIMTTWKTVNNAKSFNKAIASLTAASNPLALTPAVIHGNAADTINAGTHALDWYFAAVADEVSGEISGDLLSLC
jgi:hypothetical protein